VKKILYPLSFLFGTISSAGLLNYSGKELVNLLYFLFFIVVLPFFISLFSLIFKRAYKESSLAGVYFSLGALVALVVTISTRDIAFGWATTLDITSKDFYRFLSYFAFWKGFCKECMPSLDLIELSRFSRLGTSVTKEQVQNAVELGRWWKFLAMSLFFYGVVFRGLIYLLSLKVKPKKIEFFSDEKEEEFTQESLPQKEDVKKDELKNRSFKLLGYYTDVKDLGFQSDENSKDIVIAVKSYEPPILDFFDYLDEVIEENKDSKISLLMIGLKKEPKQKDVDVWKRKLKELKYDFVEVLS